MLHTIMACHLRFITTVKLYYVLNDIRTRCEYFSHRLNSLHKEVHWHLTANINAAFMLFYFFQSKTCIQNHISPNFFNTQLLQT